MRIGIKDVARAAGVSPATVSRTLAGGPVSADMRTRVERAIRDTGYRPNLAARRLRSQKNNTIGLIVADIRNPFFTAVARAIESAAEEEGYRIILCNTDENSEKEAFHLRQMEEERVAGVILAATSTGLKTISDWPHDIPLVLVDRAAERLTFDTVVIDNNAAAADLTDHMVKQGSRHIVCLYGQNSITGTARRNGYEHAMAHNGLQPLSVGIRHGRVFAAEDLHSFFEKNNDIDALMVSNGVLLLQVAEALMARGIAIPDGMALAGFDDELWTNLVAGGITIMAQPIEDIGRHAVSMLLSRAQNPSLGPRKMTLSAKLTPRLSSLR